MGGPSHYIDVILRMPKSEFIVAGQFIVVDQLKARITGKGFMIHPQERGEPITAKGMPRAKIVMLEFRIVKDRYLH